MAENNATETSINGGDIIVDVIDATTMEDWNTATVVLGVKLPKSAPAIFRKIDIDYSPIHLMYR